MDKNKVKKDLSEILKTENNIRLDVPMKEYTSFKVGGEADIFVEPGGISQLTGIIDYLYKNKIPYIVIGNATNIVFRDGGFRGVVIMIGPDLGGIQINDDNSVLAGSGVLLSALAKTVAGEGLTEMEFASGIPGSLGGAVFMNAGAYGGEMKDILKQVTVYDPDACKTEIIQVEDMDLSYRKSIFQTNGKIILDALIKLKKGRKEEILVAMRELAERRNSKQPVNMPSAGSFFKRPEGYYAGKLIQDAGLSGLKQGGAQISELHSGFMVNTGCATAADIEKLMHSVQDAVFGKFGVKLEPEIRIVGETTRE